MGGRVWLKRPPGELAPGAARGNVGSELSQSQSRSSAPVNPAVPKKSSAKPAAGAISWRDVEPAPVVLLTGPEEYLAGRAMENIRRQSRKQAPDTRSEERRVGKECPV